TVGAHHVFVHLDLREWPSSDDELIAVQRRLADEADSVVRSAPWAPSHSSSIGGCFVAFARGEAGPGKPGDRAWAAAVVWRRDESSRAHHRRTDHHLRGILGGDLPRRADDVVAQAVAAREVDAAYVPGLLARREGPVLSAAVGALEVSPDVLLVDATGLDHPRRGGLAVH